MPLCPACDYYELGTPCAMQDCPGRAFPNPAHLSPRVGNSPARCESPQEAAGRGFLPQFAHLSDRAYRGPYPDRTARTMAEVMAEEGFYQGAQDQHASNIIQTKGHR